jgi:TetR/AcrR family transcriptional regulator, ethionamide resistance regulator
MEPSARAVRPRAHDGTTEVEQRIFAATERGLGRVGARDLSVAQILAEAGVARGSFYHYFASKWEVINRLAAAVMRDIEARMQPFLVGDGGRDAVDRLRQSIVEGCQVWAEHRAVVRAITEHWRLVPELREMWQGVFDRFTTEIAETIERERTAGRAIAGPPARQLAATLLWSTGYCLYLAGLGEIDDLAGEEAIEESLMALWMGAVYGGGPEATRR